MKLLFAEDEKELSRATEVILKHEGYEVDAVYDGEEAWDHICENQYDGIILDIMMPKMDGIEVLTKLRERGELAPVLMLTAKAEIEDRIMGLDSGATDYLTKPFAMRELLARIRAMTRTASQMIPEKIKIGETTLNRDNFELTGASSGIRLNNREFRMMEVFMENPDKKITEDQLLERVWRNEEKEPDIVWVYISYLRNKLQSVDSELEITGGKGEAYILCKRREP